MSIRKNNLIIKSHDLEVSNPEFGFPEGKAGYISFADAEDTVMYFVNSYRCITIRQLFAYAYTVYEEARRSKFGEESSVKLKTGDVYGDASRCLVNLESRGIIKKTADSRIYYTPDADTEDLNKKKTVSPVYQLVIWFHIFYSAKIGRNYLLPFPGLNSDCLQFAADGKLYSVTPLPWRATDPYFLEKAEKIMNSSREYIYEKDAREKADQYQTGSCMREIFLVYDTETFNLLEEAGTRSEKPWFDHGVAGIFKPEMLQDDVFHPQFGFISLEKK